MIFTQFSISRHFVVISRFVVKTNALIVYLIYLPDAIQSKMGKNIEGQWQCTDCEYASQHSTNVRNHIEVNHMASVGYFCQHCDKFCKTKNALNLHRSRYKHY